MKSAKRKLFGGYDGAIKNCVKFITPLLLQIVSNVLIIRCEMRQIPQPPPPLLLLPLSVSLSLFWGKKIILRRTLFPIINFFLPLLLPFSFCLHQFEPKIQRKKTEMTETHFFQKQVWPCFRKIVLFRSLSFSSIINSLHAALKTIFQLLPLQHRHQ